MGSFSFLLMMAKLKICVKSLETTQQHFSDEYGKKIRFFTYSSDKLTEVDNFASDSGIYAMIINMRRLAACGTTLSASWWRKPV